MHVPSSTETQDSTLCLAESTSLITDHEDFYIRRFQEESDRLFGTDVDELDSLIVPRDHLEPLKAAKNIGQVLKQDQQHTQIYYHVIRQQYSWGRYLISQASLQSLLSYHRVFPRVYDLINAFGFKTGEDEKIWEGFHSARSIDRNGVVRRDCLELCYCIRYIDRNGRDPQRPWSLRQAGLYQQSQASDDPSVWILVQPPERLHQKVRELLSKVRQRNQNVRYMNRILHLAFLSATMTCWDEYIDHLGHDLTELEDKACYSRVGQEKQGDYPVAFVDKQKLQCLSRKLRRILHVLYATSAVISSLKSHLQCENANSIDEWFNMVCIEFDNYLAHCERHCRSVAMLLELAHGIDGLLSKILEFRNDRVLVQTSQAMQSSLATLNSISAQSADVAEQSKLESKTLKTLTIIATMYLPATLVATLFSSNLVQLVPNSSSSDAGNHFKLVNQFWIYVLLTRKQRSKLGSSI